MKNDKGSDGGFTYFEIIICLCIVALVVGPLSDSFLTIVKTKIAAERIQEVTNCTESLLLAIKEKITHDIVKKYSTESEQIPINDWAVAKKETLSNFFKEVLEENAIEKRFHTHQYAYEIALWHIEELEFVEDVFTVNAQTLEKAIKFYTDQQSIYQFDHDFYGKLESPITFKITDDMLQRFVRCTNVYNLYDCEEKIIDINKITFTSQDEGERVDSDIQWDEETVIESQGKVCGSQYRITYEGEQVVNPSQYTSVIQVDLSPLLQREAEKLFTEYDRNNNKSNINTNRSNYSKNYESSYTLKFVNTTAFNQVIWIQSNLDENNVPGQMFDSGFHVMAQDEGRGKSTICFGNPEIMSENYLIVIIVRDKNPIHGEKGKVIKKMIDLYSYHSSV